MTDLCLHIYSEKNTKKLLSKFTRIIGDFDNLFVTTRPEQVLSVTDKLNSIKNIPPFKVLPVDNKYNDWSGYFELIKKSSPEIVIANDSLVYRRIITKSEIKNLFDLMITNSSPCLIGEIDTSKYSVKIDGVSSISWISSYLFGIKMSSILKEKFLEDFKINTTMIDNSTKEHFENYLKLKRPDLSKCKSTNSKIIGMYFERLLFIFAQRNSFEIINNFAGSNKRKLLKLLESKFF